MIRTNCENLTYTTERYTAEITAKDYIKRFRKADYFLKFCQECRNYNRRYGCPPFDFEPLDVISKYEKVRILGVKIIPTNKHLPLTAANDLMAPVTKALNEELLEMESSSEGMAFGFVSQCHYCEDMPCARIEGKSCRHPDKVRPSLEAFGFDISKTAEELLGLEIKWSKGDFIPEYLTLVCGLFYTKA